MSVDSTDQTVKIEELREAVLKMESKAPVKADEETKKIEAPAKAKKEEPLPPDLPEDVKRPQKLIEAIHMRREMRARFVAEKLRRGVEIENELRQAEKDRNARLDAVEAHAKAQLDAIAAAYQDLGRERKAELDARDTQIEKVDLSLEQLCKQLDAELAKLTGRKVSA